MFKLLRSDFYRASRFKIFYCLIALNALVAVIGVFNTYSYYLYLGEQYNAYRVFLQGFGGGFSFLGILSAVLVSIYIGHEFSCGAMRNKIVSGGGRSKIYLSKLIVSSLMGAIVYLSYHLVNFIFGSALMGWQGASAANVALALLAGLFMTLAYCSIFTAVAMLSKNTIVSLLTGIFGALIMLMVVMWLTGEMNGSYGPDPNNPDGAIFYPCQWPVWLKWCAWIFIKLIPSGQSVLLTAGETTEYLLFIALSCVWIVMSAAGGSLLFRKTDMK